MDGRIANWLYPVLTLAVLGGCVGGPTTPAPQPSTAASPDVVARSRHCMALAMYWEARGEGDRGMVAVGSVVANRVESPRFPNTVCGVVYQGGETPPCQFSWWCDGKSDRPRDATQWTRAQSLAADVLAGRAGDPTKGALFFHSKRIPDPWDRPQTATIGGHIFYR